MRIAVVGSGYVGLVTGTCFADMGNDVWCIDIDQKKIENLKNGNIPIYEPGLEELVKKNYADGRLRFTTDIKEGISEALFVFIAVGTPPEEDGSADLQHVIQVARDIGSVMEKYLIIIDKSTVPVGTAEKVRAAVKAELDKRGRNDLEFDVVSNPEFLKEGDAIEDFLRPDRVIIGTDNVRTGELMRELYSAFVRQGDRVLVMDIPSAEMTKYAANAMLATRISFMNELSYLCEKTGADIESVRHGIGSDSRIGRSFLYAGVGYGGSCFPKDVKALIHTSKQLGHNLKILTAVEDVNKWQRERFVEKVLERFGDKIKGMKFAVWGLAFKPNTDDMREAPSIDIINSLRKKGASFRAYDPIAIETARAIIGDEAVSYEKKNYDVLEGSDALFIVTEWHHFRKPDFEKMKSLLKNPVIFDGRNLYEPSRMKELGFEYYCIGRIQ
ncbi:MAG TPA: UDP-glucose/GDP-mannose dehydrogenase family protein [Spirochaetota bacterium]|nr:UDP-glucose/GDP-mannose dehydrogenase family protein [Spirochaetota bacterium]HPI90853.1 UDP-glucose/GDP-mannose dehydrogenase family protein [Spirochaetota bacterium]HPR49949.1 UDP-glucose/GDP-mannose dehydrogenase family protein [Spirochaetota bacterium]